MNLPSGAQMERARQLLAHEGAAARGPDEPAAAAGRLHDKLAAHLAPLLGVAGVELLFARSAQLTKGEFAGLGDGTFGEVTVKLRDRLHAQDPAVATESAVALFGTFFALTSTLIGERLTGQLLDDIHQTAPTRSK